ncbi:branched-chain amino acid aminotransferase [Oscillibacter sp. MSJ-2]|uniref:Branched-chain-amino-acid aminotransferase n=1 Tax=Dysosmobacter acutus TaxID=2841504 RepID=A0ABS6F4Y5_9FIRM|nr:branched-chain amino acid aminotransferase [Dysosmobacter acutus]MBU5625352.1 branched-chain amino acid aminotransferase [Dysosmobacter acutus]
MALTITRTQYPKTKPQDYSKGFGNILTDHMFLMDYTEAEGWHDPRILPFGALALTPATMCFHYGQEIFEGMKAYRTEDGRLLLFRPMDHMRRLNHSCERICIPQVCEEELLDYLKELLKTDLDWIQDSNVDSIYIRPMIIATEPVFGARPAKDYTCMAMLTPGRPHIPKGPKPVRIYVEKEQARAVRGGTGTAKCAGNYASTFAAQAKAKAQGYTQVLWLDGAERRYVEEMGQMNIFFVIKGELITPDLSGTILDGITRRSLLAIAKDLGYQTVERRISIQEIMTAHADGTLQEAFGCGTGACIAPVGELTYGECHMNIGNGSIGTVTFTLFERLTQIQRGLVPDPYGWTMEV